MKFHGKLIYSHGLEIKQSLTACYHLMSRPRCSLARQEMKCRIGPPSKLLLILTKKIKHGDITAYLTGRPIWVVHLQLLKSSVPNLTQVAPASGLLPWTTATPPSPTTSSRSWRASRPSGWPAAGPTGTRPCVTSSDSLQVTDVMKLSLEEISISPKLKRSKFDLIRHLF